MLFLPILGRFWGSVITLVKFSSNPDNFEQKTYKKNSNLNSPKKTKNVFMENGQICKKKKSILKKSQINHV